MEVKYLDMVLGGMGMTMVVKVTEGVYGRIVVSFIIFQNPQCSYQIRNVPNIVWGVCYHSAKKGLFMTTYVLTEYF